MGLYKMFRKLFKKPTSNPVKFTTYRGKDGLFYNRSERSGRIIGDGGEGYKNRQDAESVVQNTIRAIQKGNFTINSLLCMALLAACLSGCALMGGSTTETQNAKTAGDMKTQQETTARIVLKEATNAAKESGKDAEVNLNMKSNTETTDTSKTNYYWTRSTPFLIAVGVGLLLTGGGLLLLLKFHKAAKADSTAYSAISGIANNGLAAVVSTIQNLCSSEKDDRVIGMLKTIESQAEKTRGKVNSV